MKLPINIEKLIKGEVVETERIEYKLGWNPGDLIHSMCAFANDIHNLGGGYIVIGVEEKDGVPQLPPVGLQKSQLAAIQKKLVELSNLIQPAYFGVSDVVEIQGKRVFVLHCPGGDNRPYSAPVSLSKKRKDHGYWIRRYSSTVQANQQEKKTLFELAAKIPFDDRINHHATVQDLKLSLIKEFLQNVGSPLFEQADSIPFPDLCRQMHITEGSDEQLKPINTGLLLFNEQPETFFPVTQMDVVIYRDEIGDRFSEKIFTGPIQKQLLDALEYIHTNVIYEEVAKVQGRAEADRFYNYPYAALEEVLANAVYHKSYELRNPIEVNVRPNQIEVISFPGPLPPVDNKMLKKRRIISREYRNRRIGDFLKELQLTEGRATGFPKIYDTMKRNGSPKPVFETDEDRTYFLAILPVHPAVKKRGEAGGQARGQAGGQVHENDLSETERVILGLLRQGPSSTEEIVNELGLSKRTGALQRTLKGLLEKKLVNYSYPETPRHPKQKYVLMTETTTTIHQDD